MAGLIVLDASALIAQLSSSDAHHESAVRLLKDKADYRLAASVITLAEVLVSPTRSGKLAEASEAIRDLAIESIELGGPGLPAELAQLRATTGLPLPDCCVLHATASVGAEALATFDVRLARTAGSLGISVVPS